MTDTTTVTTEVDAASGATAPVELTTGEAPKGNKEARYRVERNEARAERDALAQRVEGMNRREVERLAADAGLSMGSDLFTMSGNDASDYLTEDGDVDAEKVSADVAAVLAERPGLKRNAPAFDPSQGHGGTPGRSNPTFGDLFKS